MVISLAAKFRIFFPLPTDFEERAASCINKNCRGFSQKTAKRVKSVEHKLFLGKKRSHERVAGSAGTRAWSFKPLRFIDFRMSSQLAKKKDLRSGVNNVHHVPAL